MPDVHDTFLYEINQPEIQILVSYKYKKILFEISTQIYIFLCQIKGVYGEKLYAKVCMERNYMLNRLCKLNI